MTPTYRSPVLNMDANRVEDLISLRDGPQCKEYLARVSSKRNVWLPVPVAPNLPPGNWHAIPRVWSAIFVLLRKHAKRHTYAPIGGSLPRRSE